MLNPNLLKFIISNNLEESKVPEKKYELKETVNKMFAYSKFATVPIEVRK